MSAGSVRLPQVLKYFYEIEVKLSNSLRFCGGFQMRLGILLMKMHRAVQGSSALYKRTL